MAERKKPNTGQFVVQKKMAPARPGEPAVWADTELAGDARSTVEAKRATKLAAPDAGRYRVIVVKDEFTVMKAIEEVVTLE